VQDSRWRSPTPVYSFPKKQQAVVALSAYNGTGFEVAELIGVSRPTLYSRDCRQLQPTIGISLLAHDLFNEYPDQACWRFTLRDRLRPQVQLGPALQVHIIELRKAEKLRELAAPLRDWIACLLHNLNEAAMNSITHPPVKEALKHLETMYSDEELRLIAERREQALVDAEDIVDYARHAGRFGATASVVAELCGRPAY